MFVWNYFSNFLTLSSGRQSRNPYVSITLSWQGLWISVTSTDCQVVNDKYLPPRKMKVRFLSSEIEYLIFGIKMFLTAGSLYKSNYSINETL